MATVKAKLWLPTGEWLITDLERSYYLLPNFQIWEIANTSAKDEIKLVVDERAWILLKMMQITRDRFGRMAINSVYRTKSFNDSLPNADKNSCHLNCWAFDWEIKNQSNAERQIVADWWKNLCREFGQIGAINYYSNGYHCEIGSDIQYGYTEFKIRDHRGKKGDW